MKNRGLLLALLALIVGWAPYAHAQWMQWGQNGAHTSFLPTVQAQSPDQINWTLAIDPDVPLPPDSIFIHYAAPIVLDDGSMVVAIRHQTAIRQATYKVARIDARGAYLWGPFDSDYHYPTHNWEPVFQPIAANGLVYYPGAGGVLHTRLLEDGTPNGDVASYTIPTDDPTLQELSNTVYVGGVPAADAGGNIYWTVRTQGSPPLGLRNQVVKYTPDGSVISADFADLMGDSAFVTPLNAGPAIAADGRVYVVTRKGFPGELNRLLGLNPDLTLSCTGNLDADPTHVAVRPVWNGTGRVVLWSAQTGDHLPSRWRFRTSPLFTRRNGRGPSPWSMPRLTAKSGTCCGTPRWKRASAAEMATS